MSRLLAIDADTYERSALHGEQRIWPETNCYVDLWIEVLHSLGLDPRAGLAFTLSADFEGEQWQFVKYPLEDLRSLYRIDVAELNPWQGLEHHICEQLALGRLLTAEVDSWYLPDTAGVSYQLDHVKTSIVVNDINVEARRLGYFHGASYYELTGDDFDGVLRRTALPVEALPPYVERIRFDGSGTSNGADARPTDPDIAAVLDSVRTHLGRQPRTNPVWRLGERFTIDLDWLRAGGAGEFHGYAFATLRQCGATAELAASLCELLDEHGFVAAEAGKDFTRVAELAKTLQFKLARIAAGRASAHEELFADMAQHWASGMALLTHRFG